MNLLLKSALLAACILHTCSAQASWSWNNGDEEEVKDSLASPTSTNEQIYNGTNIEEVVDTIISSSRQGRNLKEYDEIYNDPNVQEVLLRGDDTDARNLIKDRLCSLGLMQCEDDGIPQHISPEDLVYAQPVDIKPIGQPIASIAVKNPGRAIYGAPKPVPYPNKNIPPRRYGPVNTKPYYQGPPPGKPYYPGPIGAQNPFIESQRPPFNIEAQRPPFIEAQRPPFIEAQRPHFPEAQRPHFPEQKPYEFETSSASYFLQKDIKKQHTIVENTGVQNHVHHHFHHNPEADGSLKQPSIIVTNPVNGNFKPSEQIGLGGAFSNVIKDGIFKGNNNGGQYGGQFGGQSGGQYGGQSGGQYGAQYGGQTIANYGSSTGLGTYAGSKPVIEQVGPQQFSQQQSNLYTNTNSFQPASSGYGSFGASVGSYGSSDFYKKELDVNSLHGNKLSGYEKYQGVASENYDCVCVPFDQCPTQDVIGRKDDLYLALDPRNIKTEIEAEEERVITDGNGTMSVIRVTKNATIDVEEKSESEEEKKIVKREVKEKAEEKQDDGKAKVEARQAFYGNGLQKPSTCGPRHVCCRKPLRPLIPGSSNRQCGVRHSQGINGRIKNPVYVDGDSEFGEYPWQVAILKKDPKESVYVCGGTLIDPLHILTAAHCVKTYTPFDLRVRLGEWDVNHDVEFFPYIERDIVNVHVHPEFYAGTLYNDLAIIRMDKPVDFGKYPHISPACLPTPFDDYTGTRCWTTGWGKDAFGDFGKYQNILKEVDVPVMSNGECEQRMKQTRLGYEFKLHPGFVCAGGEEGKDACKGDGGGPMVCERGGTMQLVGIVSWGIGCGQNGVPGVYVKVGHYADWIKQITQRF